MIRSAALAALFVLGAAAGHAQAPAFLEQTYSTDAACPGRDDPRWEEATRLDADGLEAIEYFCEFARVDVVFGGDGWLAAAACQEPGYFFPDLILITEHEPGPDGPRSVTVTHLGVGEEPTLYHRCAGAGSATAQ